MKKEKPKIEVKKCPECSHEYPETHSIIIQYGDKTLMACPNCGFTREKR